MCTFPLSRDFLLKWCAPWTGGSLTGARYHPDGNPLLNRMGASRRNSNFSFQYMLGRRRKKKKRDLRLPLSCLVFYYLSTCLIHIFGVKKSIGMSFLSHVNICKMFIYTLPCNYKTYVQYV